VPGCLPDRGHGAPLSVTELTVPQVAQLDGPTLEAPPGSVPTTGPTIPVSTETWWDGIVGWEQGPVVPLPPPEWVAETVETYEQQIGGVKVTMGRWPQKPRADDPIVSFVVSQYDLEKEHGARVLVKRPVDEVYAFHNRLIEQGYRAFRSTDGTARVAVPTSSGLLIYALGEGRANTEFLDHVRRTEYHERGRPAPPPNGAFLDQLVSIYRARATSPDLPRERVVRLRHRLAPYGPLTTAIDMADGSGRYIVVGPDGWHVESGRFPVFDRGSEKSLPEPVRITAEEGLGELWGLLNFRGWVDRVRILAEEITRLQVGESQPVSIIEGEAGSGKSTSAGRLSDLIDPSILERAPLPREPRDLTALAANHQTINFDNLTTLPGPAQDALCRLSTGATEGGRKLYTDHKEALVNVMPKVSITAISLLSDLHTDLLDRSELYQTSRFEESRGDELLRAQWKALHPRILGGFLDLAARTLKINAQETIPESTLRMAAMGRNVYAVCRAMGLTDEAAEIVLDQSRAVRVNRNSKNKWFSATRAYLEAREGRDGFPFQLQASALAEWIKDHKVGVLQGWELGDDIAARSAGHRLQQVMAPIREMGWQIADGPAEHHTRTYVVTGHTPKAFVDRSNELVPPEELRGEAGKIPPRSPLAILLTENERQKGEGGKI
jgi:hypothetical protein